MQGFNALDEWGRFDEAFAAERAYRILWRIGFDPDQIKYLLNNAWDEITNFYRALSYFEDLKISKGIERLPDGLTHKPIFLIRSLLRMLPAYLVSQAIKSVDEEDAYMPAELFFKVMAASYARKKDLEVTTARVNHVKNLQRCYLTLIAALDQSFEDVLRTLQDRSAIINHRHRITGDAMVFIIEECLAMKAKMRVKGLQEALDTFIESQILIPGKWQPMQAELLKDHTLKSHLLVKIQANLEQYKESI